MRASEKETYKKRAATKNVDYQMQLQNDNLIKSGNKWKEENLKDKNFKNKENSSKEIKWSKPLNTESFQKPVTKTKKCPMSEITSISSRFGKLNTETETENIAQAKRAKNVII